MAVVGVFLGVAALAREISPLNADTPGTNKTA